jgi:hypothetical protein
LTLNEWKFFFVREAQVSGSVQHLALTISCGVVLSSGRPLMSLTGRFHFRKTLRGCLLLIVEEEIEDFGEEMIEVEEWERWRWRCATLEDLAEPAMRALIDLRSEPRLRARGPVKVETAQLPPSGGTPLPSRSPETQGYGLSVGVG